MKKLLLFIMFKLILSKDEFYSSDEENDVNCSNQCQHKNCRSMLIKYGNYCGVDHTGCKDVKPCDKYDECCMVHDKCIDNSPIKLMDLGCHYALSDCLNRAVQDDHIPFTDYCDPYDVVQSTIASMDIVKKVAEHQQQNQKHIRKDL